MCYSVKPEGMKKTKGYVPDWQDQQLKHSHIFFLNPKNVVQLLEAAESVHCSSQLKYRKSSQLKCKKHKVNNKSLPWKEEITTTLTASSSFTISNLGLYVKSTICSQSNGIDPRTCKMKPKGFHMCTKCDVSPYQLST